MGKFGRTHVEIAGVSSTSPVISHKVTKAVAAAAGSFSRKFPEAKRAGQNVAGDSNMVKITKHREGGFDGKQTWKGSIEGYTTRAIPAYKPANVGGNTLSSGNHAKQKVK